MHIDTDMQPDFVASQTTAEPESERDEMLPATELWQIASTQLRRELSEGNFSAWFDRSTPLGFDGRTFLLAVPSLFVKGWIETRYQQPLNECLERVSGRPLSVALVVDESLAPDGEEPSVPQSSGDVAGPQRDPSATAFHPKYTFDSFVIGSSNRFAHAAALAVGEAPADAYNPLFIYGGAGLGKTHLLHAIGRYVQESKPSCSVRYISTEQFMNDFIVALQRRTIPNFHSRYRVTDLLLVDDVQFLEGKERTQEEFFHTFNALHPTSQIVLTSDRPPKKISTLEERLRTRFEWGLITDIQPPDLETRLAILQRKVEADGLSVPDDVMAYIASRIQTNIRELEGALIRVAAYASLTRSETTLDMAQNILHSLLPNAAESRISSDLIISVAAEYFGVSTEEISSPSRSRPLVNARQVAMYLCRELTDLSLIKIGERFGGRDHSTVVFAVNKVRQQMQERESCYEQVRELTSRVRQQSTRR